MLLFEEHTTLERQLYCILNDNNKDRKDSCNTVDEPLTWNMFSSKLPSHTDRSVSKLS